MNIRDRLMSRASVAVMAAFAPDGLPPGAERIEDAGGNAGGDMDDMGLTAEEQAQFDAMRNGAGADDKGNVDPSGGGDPDGADAGDDDGDPDIGNGDPGPDRVAPGDKDGITPPADGEKRTPKTINYGRHQKEMAKAQKEREDLQARLAAAEKERNEAREARTRLDERAKLLLEAINTKQPPAAAAPAKDEDPEPDADIDPLGHVQWENRQLKKDLAEIKSGRQKEQEVSAAEADERKVYGDFSASLEQEARNDPAFADAFVHLRETRFRELGFIYADIDITDAAQCATLTPQQQAELSRNIQQAFYNEQIMVARGAIQAGKNPAKVVKNLALSRGYTPKPPADVAGAGSDSPPKSANGAAKTPPARQQAPPPSVTDQLEQIRANQKDAKSLSDAGGSPGGDITVERLATMSDDEFAQFYETMPKAKLDRIMGKVPQ